MLSWLASLGEPTTYSQDTTLGATENQTVGILRTVDKAVGSTGLAGFLRRVSIGRSIVNASTSELRRLLLVAKAVANPITAAMTRANTMARVITASTSGGMFYGLFRVAAVSGLIDVRMARTYVRSIATTVSQTTALIRRVTSTALREGVMLTLRFADRLSRIIRF